MSEISTNTQTTTRQEARDLGRKTYYTGIPCKHGHNSDRFVSDGKCVACRRERDRKRYLSRRDERLAYNRRYYQENRERLLADSAEWQRSNKEKRKEISSRYYRSNADTVLALRASRITNEMPKWLSDCQKQEIVSLYIEARRLTRETGVLHHVDHIVPINGRNVTGLHVPWNLQVITAQENIQKGGKLIA